MALHANNFWQKMKPGIRATAWAFFLFTPIIYYQLYGGHLAILIGILTALMPLTFTFIYLLPHSYRDIDSQSIGEKAASFLAATLPVSTVAVIYYLPWIQAGLKVVILWAVGGIAVGIMWTPDMTPKELLQRTKWSIIAIWRWKRGVVSIEQRLSPNIERVIIAYITLAVLQMTLMPKSLGTLGVAVGPATICGLYAGFILSFLVKHLYDEWRALWEKLIDYSGPLATFVVGYIVIIYVFAGLFAMMWRFNPSWLDPNLHKELHFGDFLYYSLSTISTLGYSEIKPAGGPARILTAAEFFAGVFWITAVIGLLISTAQKTALAESTPVPRQQQMARKAANN